MHADRQDRVIAAYAALAAGIHVLESAIPMPVPGIKPGLANVITLLVLCRHGWRAAAWVTVLRVMASSLLLGTFLTPTFLLSASGAFASLTAMGLLAALGRHREWFGPVGFGVAGGMAHMGGQLFFAWAVFVPHPGLLRLAPVFLTAGLVTGALNGIICGMVLNRLVIRAT